LFYSRIYFQIVALLETDRKPIEQHLLSENGRNCQTRRIADELMDRLGFAKDGKRHAKGFSRCVPLPGNGPQQNVFVEVIDRSSDIALRVIAEPYEYRGVDYPSRLEISIPGNDPLVDSEEALILTTVFV
jgi:hypothetical protein